MEDVKIVLFIHTVTAKYNIYPGTGSINFISVYQQANESHQKYIFLGSLFFMLIIEVSIEVGYEFAK